IGVIAGPSASASGGGTASAAKKKKTKCKPGFKKVAVKVKGKTKKKCRKQATTPTTPAPTAAPLVRATLTWTGAGMSGDYDLWVFDANGNKAKAVSNTIPNSSFSGNAAGEAGTETFTDNIFVQPGARVFSYGVCQVDGSNNGATFNLDYVTADGVHHAGSDIISDDGGHREFNGGAQIPAAYCP
ncbi:MAG: hypothetical protein ACXWD7_02450, partial [Solirubrobacterales bacterium]